MGRQIAVALYIVTMIVVIVGVVPGLGPAAVLSPMPSARR
jgi:hypothetical protein